jgi:hypothetical protein
MAKFEDIHGLFKYVKKQIFMQHYAKINPNSGFNHRFSGQIVSRFADGKTIDRKKLELSKDDYKIIADGLDVFILDCIEFRDKLKAGKFN